jgi:glycosyltransferase involved in cell wall biosynthesis
MRGNKCRLRSKVREALREGRYCLVHSQGFETAVQVVLANTFIGVPHVITAHQVILPQDFPGPLGLVKKWLLARLLRRAEVLIAVSNDACENYTVNFRGLAAGHCRLVTIVNGIDIQHFSGPLPQRGAIRQQIGLETDTFLLGFLGRFMEQKGFLVLVDAIDRLLAEGAPRPFHLLAVGSGDYIRKCQAEVARRPRLAGRITFVPQVESSASILGELDLLVMPSLWEACPLLPMEALVVGTPVLGTDCIGLREVLHDTPSRMVRAGDAIALAEGLGRAIESPWTDEARAFTPTACARFDVVTSVSRLRQIFDQYARVPQYEDNSMVIEPLKE